MNSNPQPQKQSRGGLGISLFLLFISLAVVGAAAWFFVTKVQPALDPMSKLKGALETITQNQITQEGSSLEIQTNNIQELAVIERDSQSIIKYETLFLGSKKTLILKGNFKIKAGFDLTKASQFSIINGKVSGHPPKAEILSVEMIDYEIFHSQDGAFNKLTPQDQESATNALLEQARQDAQNSNLRQQAELQFQQRLDDLMQGSLENIL